MGTVAERLRLQRPDDWHVHLRQHELMQLVVPHTSEVFARALIMPNTVPPVLDADQARRYSTEIKRAASSDFTPLMTIQITPATSPSMIVTAAKAGVVAGKLYPEGVTTGADVGGVRDFDELWPIFGAMAERGMVLCLHGEVPGAPVLTREEEFLPTLERIALNFPALRMVLEHVSTAAAVDHVRLMPNVAATITAHHLWLTIDDVLSDRGIQPHHFCKPVAKSSDDRDALVAAATSGDPQFFFGSDSAPHRRSDKESAAGPPGVFSSPVALPILAEVFEQADALYRLEGFVSINGARYYGVEENAGVIELERRKWTVPNEFGDVVPLASGRELSWQVVRGVDG